MLKPSKKVVLFAVLLVICIAALLAFGPAALAEVECEDSDGGTSVAMWGRTGPGCRDSNAQGCLEDICISSTILREYKCYGNEADSSEFECDYLCERGACIPQNPADMTINDISADGLTAGSWDAVKVTVENLGGSYGHYNLRVDWGDGSEPYYTAKFTPEEKPDRFTAGATAIKPYSTSTDEARHTYKEPRTYTIQAEVAALHDKNSANDFATKTVTVTAPHVQGPCRDSDEGIDMNTRGTTLNQSGNKQYEVTDSCSGSTLHEYYCDENGYAQVTYIECSLGCGNGACLTDDSVDVIGSSVRDTLKKEQARTYNLKESKDAKGRLYKVMVDFVGSGGAVFTINSESTGLVLSGKDKIISDDSIVRVHAIQYTPAGIVDFSITPQAKNTCTDSDGGKNPGEKGITMGYWRERELKEEDYVTNEDYCVPALGPYDLHNSYQGVVAKEGMPGVYESYCVNSPIDNIPRVNGSYYPCPYGCKDGACLDAPTSYTLKISKGWNIVSATPFIALYEVPGTTTTCSSLADYKYLYEDLFTYDKRNKRYVKLGDQPDIVSEPKDGFLINSYLNGLWLRSKEDCEIKYSLPEGYEKTGRINGLHEISKNGYKVPKGWSLMAVWPDIEGKTLDDIKGGCEIQKAYAYFPDRRKWESVLGTRFDHEAVGHGYAMKVADDCVLGEEGPAGEPPALPD